MCKCAWRLPLVGLLVLALGGAVYAFDPDSDPSLRGWWKFDEGAGTTAIDSSGQGHNGTLINGPVWTTGYYGGGIQFDGVDDYVDTGWTENLAKWTIACWVTSPAAPSSSGAPSGPLHREANYQINWNHNGGWAGFLGISVGGSWMGTTFGTLQANTWYHLCGTYDGTNLTAYTNGVQASQISAPGTPSSESNSLKFGRHAANAQYFAGTVDDARVYNRALDISEIKQMMASGGQGPATNPSPKDKATDVVREVGLSWKPGPFAGTHDVFFGTQFDDVNNASAANPLGVLASTGQTASTYNPPARLDFDTTYYWRVDEVNATADKYTYKGTTWRFTTEPFAYPIQNITATASGASATGPAINTINGSGMTGDLHGTDAKTMWLAPLSATQPAWIQYDVDRVYKVYELWVWNQNTAFESILGFGAKNVAVEYSVDGTTWTKLGDFEFARAPGQDGYAHNTTVPFNGVAAKSVRLTISTNWGGIQKQTGLSEVRFLYIPVQAREPQPASGSTAVDPTTLVLSWRAGREAASHDVYIGADSNAVKASTTPTGTAGTASFVPAGLQLSATYYWKVDEVNTAEALTTWSSDVWSFTTADFVSVDDMESYNDTNNQIFNVWLDGYGTTTNGALVGYNSAVNSTFGETVIVHDGKQSMPLMYNNTGSFTLSEATRTFADAQDWTAAGIKTLVLFFHGAPDNVAGDLYVKINSTKITYPGDAAIFAASVWKQWNIDLTAISGLKAVKSLTIGITGSGSGTLYFDDIRLYKSAPAVVQPTDPGTANLVAYYAMEGDAKDSKGSYNGTVNDITFVNSMAGLGKAAQFNGTTGYIDLGASFGSGVINSLSNSTFAMWVNYTGTGNAWQRTMDFGSSTTAYVFMTTRNAGIMPRFAIIGSGKTEVGATASRSLSVGWHHLTGVIDASTMTLALYVDGALAQGNVATEVLPKDLGATTNNWLGRSQWTADPYLNGALDEVRIYNRVLSAGEIGYLAGDR
jgi:hypothetical protein